MKTDLPTYLGKSVWYVHRVSYGETDTMGYLYYAEYLHIFERTRSEYIRSLGMSYREVEKRGMMLPVREAFCRYRQPSRYDDTIHVQAGITELGRASLTFTYVVMDSERQLVLATGRTEHACATLEGKPLRMPDWFKQLLKP